MDPVYLDILELYAKMEDKPEYAVTIISPEGVFEYILLNSENKGFTQTLINRFLSGNINFSTEYLDTKRVEFNKGYQDFFYHYLKQKYVHYSPDVIFCSDDNALSFLLKFKERLFENVPVVFCGVNNLDVKNALDRK